VIIQCKNEEQYSLLCGQILTIPLGDLKIDIDPDVIPKEIQEEFLRLGEQA
jgi:hypothetical protein